MLSKNFPCYVVCVSVGSFNVQAIDDVSPLVLFQKLGFIREVDQEKDRDDTNYNCEYPLKYENLRLATDF